MPTGSQPLLTGDVAALTARLDGLSADQNPEDLSRTLGIVFERRELYKRYLSSLDGDVNRAKALLEVFDKVNPENVCYYLQRCFSISLHHTGSHGTHVRRENIQEVSPALWPGGISPRFPHYT